MQTPLTTRGHHVFQGRRGGRRAFDLHRRLWGDRRGTPVRQDPRVSEASLDRRARPAPPGRPDLLGRRDPLVRQDRPAHSRSKARSASFGATARRQLVEPNAIRTRSL
jgi:hypothetical protein